MSGNESPPPDEINWEAYSHEELHRMLWQDADVADVSTVASEWTRHRAALDTHAEVLREQRTALLDGWRGAAAEEAGARLAALAARVEKISELAAAGQKAAQDAADALAAARAEMPPPPVAPELPTTPAGAAPFALPSAPAPFALPAAPSGAAPFALPSAPSPFALPSAPSFALPTTPASAAPFVLPSAPAPFTLPSAPTMPTTFTPGFSFYFGVASADQQKAQAVRAMQTYESSLNGSGRLIDDARGNVPPAAAAPARPAAPQPTRTPSSGGVPWRRLTGGATATAPRGGPVIGSVSPVSAPAQVTPGMRTGVMAPSVLTGMTSFAADTSSRSAAQPGGMAPQAGGARKDEDQPHENQMPTLDHGLFTVDERVSPSVIGEEVQA